MTRTTVRTESIRQAYAAFSRDPDLLWARCSPDVTFHIAGHHPLSGDYVGLDAVKGYLAAARAACGGRSDFVVASAFTNETGDLLLVEGTALHGEEPFMRTVVHLLRFVDGRLVEFWDNPFDQRAEDRFWRARIPEQRSARDH